jgi:hypothetical protein
MWHKAWAQPSQAVAGRPHHLGRPAMCWCISKNRFVYMFSRGGAQGIQCPMAVQGETWPPGQVAWPAGLTCAPHMPNLQAPPYSSYKYHGAPLGRKCEESEV